MTFITAEKFNNFSEGLDFLQLVQGILKFIYFCFFIRTIFTKFIELSLER